LLKEKLKTLPNKPGCYLFYNKNKTIIYVGKAKNLKNRVGSYFVGAHNFKTTRLVAEIVDFSFLITKTETEALLLEFNLIKENTPKYNIKLIDDKSYPYIVVTKEQYPKIIVSRDLTLKGDFFGPYPNVYAAKQTARLLNKLYPFRKCDKLPKEACLYYHLGQCLAPCIREVNYDEMVKEVKSFLKGDTKNVINLLKTKMSEAAQKLHFEEAQEYKIMMESIEEITEKQVVTFSDFKDRDIISYAYNDDKIVIQILKMRQGRIVDAKSTTIDKLLDEKAQILSYLYQYYQQVITPEELLLDKRLEEEDLSAFKSVQIPKIGDKYKLVKLAYDNALYDLTHYSRLHESKSQKKAKAEREFKELLKIEDINQIDIFDNSHLYGTNPISALVVYRDFKPKKQLYRKYHLKEKDDYNGIKEVFYRRYQRALLENERLPDLIIVDGGKGQVNAGKAVLDALFLTIPIIGLKKNKAHQLESVVTNEEEFVLKKGSSLYTLLAGMSDEVHRFAVTFHKRTRTKNLLTSRLDNIKGVGPVRKQRLFAYFKTITNMKTGTVKEYQQLGINEKLRMEIIKGLENYEKKNPSSK
jgi:excinuclease ABC subunit C